MDDLAWSRLVTSDPASRFAISSARVTERQRRLRILYGAHFLHGRAILPIVDPQWPRPEALSVAIAKSLWSLASPVISRRKMTKVLSDDWPFFESLVALDDAGPVRAVDPHAIQCVSRILQYVALRTPVVVTILLRRPRHGCSHSVIARHLLSYRDTFLLRGTHWIFVGSPHTLRRTLLSYSQLRSIVSEITSYSRNL